jgi:glycine cleavage system aminomethyltransferase T
VPMEYTQLGTELEVETPVERTSAVVVRRPFIDPEKEIPRQDLATTGARDESST